MKYKLLLGVFTILLAFSFLHTVSATITASDPALRLYYNFDNETQLGGNISRVWDVATNILNGTIVNGGIYNKTGKILGGYFNNNGHINISDNKGTLNISGALTINAWVAGLNVGGGYIVARDGASGVQYRLRYDGSNVCFGGQSDEACAPQNNTGWHMWTGLRNATHESIFYDSTLKAITALGTIGWTNITYIGTRGSGEAGPETDDMIGIWNRSLSIAEISQLYNASVGLEYAFDGNNNTALSPTVFINPTLLTPINNSNFSSSTQTFSANATTDGVTTVKNGTLSIYNSTGQIYFNVTNSTTGLTNMTMNWTIPNIADGKYAWNVLFYNNNSNSSRATSNNTFTIDTTAPIVNVTYPDMPIYYTIAGNNLTLNWTYIELNPSAAWFVYNNNANQSLTIGVNSSFQVNNDKNKTVYVYMNDSAGNVGVDTGNWTYYDFEYSNGVASPVLAGSAQTFTYNFSSGYIPSTINLIYNGTSYSTVITNTDTNQWTATATLNVPLANSTTTKNVYWSLLFTDGTRVNSTATTQVLSPIVFALCSQNVNTTVLNISALDEVTGSSLNFSLSAVFNYFNSNSSGSSTLNYSYANITDSNYYYAFCVTPASTFVNVSATVSYTKAGYGVRTYYFTNSQFSNNTQNLALSLLNASQATTVQFLVINQVGFNVANAFINVQKWNLGTNTYTTVNVLQTDPTGKAAADLQLNSAWYRYQVTWNNVLYLVTTPLIETQTSRTLTINTGATTPYNNFNSVYGSVTWNNNTQTFTYTFADTSGTVGSGCMQVNQWTTTASNILNINCINASSGTMTYTITQGNGTYIAYGYANLNSNFQSVKQILSTLSETIGGSVGAAVTGKAGFIIFLIILVTAGAIAASANSILLGGVLFIGAVIFGGLIGWFSFSGMMIPVSLAVIFIFIAIKAYGSKMFF